MLKKLECDYDVSKTGKRHDFNVSSSESPATQECQLLNRHKAHVAGDRLLC